LFIQICRAILVFAGAEGKSADLPGILGAISVSGRLIPNINGSYNGAFTYFFCKHMRDANAALTRSEGLKRLRASLRFNKYVQVPQLECPAEKLKKKVLE
jgi:hypothetical protein